MVVWKVFWVMTQQGNTSVNEVVLEGAKRCYLNAQSKNNAIWEVLDVLYIYKRSCCTSSW
jgi:hypothetical protein